MGYNENLEEYDENKIEIARQNAKNFFEISSWDLIAFMSHQTQYEDYLKNNVFEKEDDDEKKKKKLEKHFVNLEKEKQRAEKKRHIIMGNIEKKDIYQILNTRIKELQQFYEEHGKSTEEIDKLYEFVDKNKKEKLVMEVSEIEYADDKMLSREKFLEFILNNIIDLSKRKSIYSRVGFVGTFLKDKYKAIKDRFVNDKKNVDCR